MGSPTEALKALDSQNRGAAVTPIRQMEKYNDMPAFPREFQSDDGRRYDPEALNYGQSETRGFAR